MVSLRDLQLDFARGVFNEDSGIERQIKAHGLSAKPSPISMSLPASATTWPGERSSILRSEDYLQISLKT